ncbi:hypothetical protein D3C72_2206810 [compost metagenome]
MVQKATMLAVNGSPWLLICQMPSNRLALIFVPSRRMLINGSLKAKGISNSMVTATAVRRVIDQSRPFTTLALQRGQ